MKNMIVDFLVDENEKKKHPYIKEDPRITASMLPQLCEAVSWGDEGSARKQFLLRSCGVDNVGNAATEFGTENEARAINELALRIDDEIIQTGSEQRFHTRALEGIPVGAHPDGIIERGAVVEVKCPFRDVWKEMPENYAMRYFSQVQLQMFCARKNKALFFIYDADSPGESYLREFALDKGYLTRVAPELARFWISCITILRDKELLEKFLGAYDEVDCSAPETVLDLIAVDHQIAELQKKRKMLVDDFRKKFGKRNIAFTDEEKVILRSMLSPSQIVDKEKVKEAMGEVPYKAWSFAHSLRVPGPRSVETIEEAKAKLQVKE